MPLKGIAKPNLSGNLRTGFKLIAPKVARASRPERPSAKGPIGTNHPIVTVYARKTRKKMY